MTHVLHCPQCGNAIDAAQSESWCVGCGTPLDDAITSRLPKVVAQRAAVVREVASPQAEVTLSRGARVFRGMLGMGMTFGAVGFALVGTLAGYSLFAGFDRDDMDFMIVASIGWAGIAFGLGMLYAGLLALVARGRAFHDVSIARVGLAGAVIGLIPLAVVAAGSWLGPGTLSVDEVASTLTIFPPISAAIAMATLLIARRAKPELGAGDEPSALKP